MKSVESSILVITETTCRKAVAIWRNTLTPRDEPRRVLDELGELRVMDVVLPTSEGTEIRRRCISRPNEHQAILLERLGFQLPRYLETTEM